MRKTSSTGNLFDNSYKNKDNELVGETYDSSGKVNEKEIKNKNVL